MGVGPSGKVALPRLRLVESAENEEQQVVAIFQAYFKLENVRGRGQ
jgi:hypothetical protein